MTTLVAGVKTGYTFGGWYLTSECDGTAITELGAQDYTADITLYAKWTFAMEYNITNTETIFITSAKGQTVKVATQLTLQVNNMPVGSKVAMSAPNITFYDEAGNAVSELTTKYNPESFKLTAAYPNNGEHHRATCHHAQRIGQRKDLRRTHLRSQFARDLCCCS